MRTPLREEEKHFVEIAKERDLSLVETSSDEFDRIEYAKRVLDLVCPPHVRVAICEGHARVSVDSGRRWGRATPDDRWAILSVHPRASRRAIALGALALARTAKPYALDVLLASLDDRAA